MKVDKTARRRPGHDVHTEKTHIYTAVFKGSWTWIDKGGVCLEMFSVINSLVHTLPKYMFCPFFIRIEHRYSSNL